MKKNILGILAVLLMSSSSFAMVDIKMGACQHNSKVDQVQSEFAKVIQLANSLLSTPALQRIQSKLDAIENDADSCDAYADAAVSYLSTVNQSLNGLDSTL